MKLSRGRLLFFLVGVIPLSLDAEAVISPSARTGYEILIPEPASVSALWVDGVPSALTPAGGLPIGPGEHSIAILGPHGQLYAAEFRIQETGQQLRIVESSFGGPDVQKFHVQQKEFKEVPSTLFISESELFFWHDTRISVFDAYDLRLLQVLQIGSTSNSLKLQDGSAYYLDRKSETKTSRGENGQTVLSFRVMRLDLREKEVEPISPWKSADWAVLEQDGPHLLLITDGPSVHRVTEGIFSKVALGLPEEPELEAESWKTSLVVDSWLLARSKTGQLAGLSIDGKAAYWHLDTVEAIEGFTVCDGHLILRFQSDKIISVLPSNGEILWRETRTEGVEGSLVCSRRKLYGLDRHGDLISISPRTGLSMTIDLRQRGLSRAASLVSLGDRGLLLTMEPKGLVVLDPELGLPTLVSPEERRVRMASASTGVLTVVDLAGRLTNYPMGAGREIVGRIESVDETTSMAKIDAPAGLLRSLSIAPADWLLGADPESYRLLPADEVLGSISWSEADSFHQAELRQPLTLFGGEPLVYRGALSLSLEPKDSFIWIQGRFQGRGSQTLRGLHPGFHELRIVHPDRQTHVEKVEISAEEIRHIQVRLQTKQTAILRIEPDLEGAQVLLDGDLIGVSPLSQPLYGLGVGQVVDVAVRKLGFNTARARIPISAEGSTFSPSLSFAPLFGQIFLGATDSAPFIKGWPNDQVFNDGTLGDPIFSKRQGQLFLTADIEFPFSSMAVFLRGEVSTGESTDNEWEVGVRHELFSYRRAGAFQVALSYLQLPAREKSEPPCTRSSGQGCTRDAKAPLEDWSHPIEAVRVANSKREYARLGVIYRPAARVFLEASYAELRKAQLKGTALDPGADGHLVESDRSYVVDASEGMRMELKLQFALATLFRIKRLSPSLALELRYRRSHTQFLDAIEESDRISLSLGLFDFWDQGVVLPKK